MFAATPLISNTITVLLAMIQKTQRQQQITSCDSAGREGVCAFAITALIFHVIKELNAEPFKILWSTNDKLCL